MTFTSWTKYQTMRMAGEMQFSRRLNHIGKTKFWQSCVRITYQLTAKLLAQFRSSLTTIANQLPNCNSSLKPLFFLTTLNHFTYPSLISIYTFIDHSTPTMPPNYLLFSTTKCLIFPSYCPCRSFPVFLKPIHQQVVPLSLSLFTPFMKFILLCYIIGHFILLYLIAFCFHSLRKNVSIRLTTLQ